MGRELVSASVDKTLSGESLNTSVGEAALEWSR